CIDNHHATTVTVNGYSVPVQLCDEVHKAQADSHGDFVFDPVMTGAGGAEDAFAEVQMFYHVNRIYDFFKTLGFEELIDSQTNQPGPIQATVNFRIPIDVTSPPANILAAIQQATDVNAPLFAFDNAFFFSAASSSQFLTREHDS